MLQHFQEVAAGEVEGRQRVAERQDLKIIAALDRPGGQAGAPTPELEKLLRNMAQKHFEQLDAMPDQPGGRIKELRDYDFMDPEARQQFEELLDTLQQQVMQNYFKGIEQGIQSMTEEDLQQMSQMVKDLNELTKQKLSGTDPDITDFMAKWGHMFPPGIETFDQLVEHMQQVRAPQ